MQCEIYHDRENEACPHLGAVDFSIVPRVGEFIATKPDKTGKQWQEKGGFVELVPTWRITEIMHDIDKQTICVFVVPRQPVVSVDDEEDKPW